MKYCSHCGNELLDEAVICPSCGCKVASTKTDGILEEDDKKVFRLIIKIFMILGCIASGWAIIPLLWTIPLTTHVFKKLNNNEPIGIAVKVCSLLFVNIVAGIMLLCMNEIEDL